MIVANRKDIRELRAMVERYERVLIVGCGTCVTVCLAGGERETAIIGSALRMALRLAGKTNTLVDECTVERQCDLAFFDPLSQQIERYDAILSLGCGVGVQELAERFPNIAVLPGLNTQFMGTLEEQGIWGERCVGCGNCLLGEFGAVCPLARCAKRMTNGPCGGSRNGRCEVNRERACAWQLIYDRMKTLGQLDRLRQIAPIMDWSRSNDGGPRRVVREDQRIASSTSTHS
ncbi:methylenetetrahydrofolate reductase C-terminal domain-containing protein [Candidatus Sumerlaeota bacterium]|nr:methylenetetrahydrofolate reductase C-terminal domain-containing protein [Candidatus Sumerlaeota bacterium]